MNKGSKKNTKYTSVSIPIQLYEKIKKRLSETDFSSVSDYVTYILREVLATVEEEEEEVFTEEDEKKIKERLRSLGYLD